jgi:hypothetical protein
MGEIIEYVMQTQNVTQVGALKEVSFEAFFIPIVVYWLALVILTMLMGFALIKTTSGQYLSCHTYSVGFSSSLPSSIQSFQNYYLNGGYYKMALDALSIGILVLIGIALIFWLWMIISMFTSKVPRREKGLWAVAFFAAWFIAALAWFFVGRGKK